MSDFLYPLDTTGSALSNRVRGELQTLSPPTQSDHFHFVIPKAGPYYRDTMKLTHVSSGRELIMGVDWEPGHYFYSASIETENAKGGIYQSILFLDRTLSGQISFDEYYVLGGHWSLEENKILEILSNKLWDPRVVTYEHVSGKPEVFPPIAHMHAADDLVGMREQVEATYQVSAAIREQTGELPGKLQLILKDYYTARDIDDLLAGIADSLIDSIAGPHLEEALRDIVTSMIGNYYTKAEVDSRLQQLTNAINSRYTNLQIEEKLAGKVDLSVYQQAISQFVTQSAFQSAIDNLIKGQLTQGDLDRLAASLTEVDVSIQQQLDVITNTLDQMGTGVEGYMRADEFDDIMDKSNITKAIRDSISKIADDLKDYETSNDARVGTLERNLSDKVSETDVYRILANQTLDISDSVFPPISISAPGTDELGNPTTIDYLNASAEWINKNTPTTGTHQGIKFTVHEDAFISYYHQGNEKSKVLPTGEYIIDSATVGSDGHNTPFFIILNIEPASGTIMFTVTELFTGPDLTSTPVYRFILNGGSAPLGTNPRYTETVEIEHELTPSELSGTSVQIELPADKSVPIVSILKTVYMWVSTYRCPIDGYAIEQVQGVSNKLTIYKPPIDLSAMGSFDRVVTLKVVVDIITNR